MSTRRGNPNWATPLHLAVVPAGASTFEHVVVMLQLSPEEYESSVALKDWVRKNKNKKYVPSELLQAWGFTVDTGA